MASIVRGRPNSIDAVNWFLTVDGELTDAETFKFRVFDIHDGLPGVQVFPVGGGYEVISGTPGRFDVGSYYVFDTLNGQGWTPSIAEPLGTHRVEWSWQMSAGGDWFTDFEDFEVLAQPLDAPSTYCTLADVRAEGITSAQASDAKVNSYIATWQAFLDRACRQWFIPRTLLLQVDGSDSDAMHLGIAVISVEYLKLNNDPNPLDPGYFRVYNGRSFPDDRRNPRIKLIGPSDYRDIYTAPMMDGRLLFRKGRKNQTVKGIFGFVEEDGLPPLLIKRALIKLVVEKLTKPIYLAPGSDSTSSPLLSSVILEEETDGHRLKYGTPGGGTTARKSGIAGMTDDPEVLDIIKLYRAPLGVATPAHWSYR